MDLKDLSFEETKAFANSVEGFNFHHMTGEVKLKEDLAIYLEANPDKIPRAGDPPDPNEGDQNPPPGPPVVPPVIPEPPVVPPEPPVIPEPPENTGLVKIQSDYRGEIASSFGILDFGTDGICEVSEEAAEMLCKLKGYVKC